MKCEEREREREREREAAFARCRTVLALEIKKEKNVSVKFMSSVFVGMEESDFRREIEELKAALAARSAEAAHSKSLLEDANEEIRSLKDEVGAASDAEKRLQDEVEKYSKATSAMSNRVQVLEKHLLKMRQTAEASESLRGLLSFRSEMDSARKAGVEITPPGERALAVLSESSFIVNEFWKQLKNTEIKKLRPKHRDLSPRDLIQHSNDMLQAIQKQLQECRRMHDGRGESSSLLYSLLPFSSGAGSVLFDDASSSSSSFLWGDFQRGGGDGRDTSDLTLERRIGDVLYGVLEDIAEHKLRINAYTEGLLDNTLRKMEEFNARESSGDEKASVGHHAMGAPPNEAYISDRRQSYSSLSQGARDSVEDDAKFLESEYAREDEEYLGEVEL